MLLIMPLGYSSPGKIFMTVWVEISNNLLKLKNIIHYWEVWMFDRGPSSTLTVSKEISILYFLKTREYRWCPVVHICVMFGITYYRVVDFSIEVSDLVELIKLSTRLR